MQMKSSYSETFRVVDTDCDMNGKMFPGALLRKAQQISTDQCETLGMDQAFYLENKVVFLMGRLAMHWDRVPCCGETLTFNTMPENAKRAIYKRLTLVLDEQGQQIGLVDTRWVLVDIQTHRIIRRPPEAIAALPFNEEVPYSLDMTLPKVQQLEPAGQAAAWYTYCDTNGHLNNTKYADIICDALPLELVREKPVTDLVISFHNEVPAGESFQVERVQLEDGSWYVTGSKEGKTFFEAKATLA